MKPKKKLWLILLILFFETFGVLNARTAGKLQTFVLPGDSLNQCFALYQINYSDILFEKSNGRYEAKVTVSLEVYDSLKNLFRDEKSRAVTAADYRATKNKSKFISFLFKLNLPAGDFLFKSAISQNGKPGVRNLKDKKLHIKKNTQINGSLLFVSDNIKENKGRVISFGEFYPFGDIKPVVFFVSKNKLQSPEIFVTQNGEEVSHSKGKKFNCNNLDISVRNDSPFVKFNCDKENRSENVFLYSFEESAAKLIPGSAILKLNSEGKFQSFKISIIWKNKPKILNDWEKTIEALSFIFPKKELRGLYSANENQRLESLFDLWKRYDDNPGTAFNPLMNEFFRRVDYAETHFTVKKRTDGYKTDMGKIYIRYGKPVSIERKFNTLNLPIEIWNYGNRNYIFVDKNQNGKYELMEIK